MPDKSESHMPSLGDSTDVQQQMVTGLHKIGMAIRHASWAGGEVLGLTPSQGQILQVLQHRSGQDVRLDDVARELAVTRATASVAVKALVEKGLVVRQPSASDGRAISLELSDEGRGVARQSAGWTDFLAEAVGTLEPGEQSMFQRAVVKMIRTMQEQQRIPIARMCVNCEFFRPNAHPGEAQPHHCAYVDAAFGDRELRLDCNDFSLNDSVGLESVWQRFVGNEISAD